MKRTVTAVVLAAVIVLAACNPVPSWVRSVLNSVVYTGPSGGPVGLPQKPPTLSCAISVSRALDARKGDFALRDPAWSAILRKDPMAFAKFCAVPALNQGKSLPVFKYEYGSPLPNDNRAPGTFSLLIYKNPNWATLLGVGWFTFPMDPGRFRDWYAQAWAQHPNLVLGDLG